MNKETRAAAIKRIQKAHDGGHCNSPHIPYNHCSELLKVIAAAERENEELRGYVEHRSGCHGKISQGRDYKMCNCKLDEILNKEPDNNAGWRSCIDHIIKPRHRCPVCRADSAETTLKSIGLAANKAVQPIQVVGEIKALLNKESDNDHEK